VDTRKAPEAAPQVLFRPIARKIVRSDGNLAMEFRCMDERGELAVVTLLFPLWWAPILEEDITKALAREALAEAV
jgi:hypothetical protein